MKYFLMTLACVLLLGNVSCQKHESTNDGGNNSLLKIGDEIPSPNALTDPSKAYNAIGNVALVVFFSPACSYCKQSMPAIQSIWERYSEEEDFYLMAVGINGVAYESYLAENNYTFPTMYDDSKAIFHTFASSTIPRFYLFSKAGFLTWQGSGYLEDRYTTLTNEIDKLL